MKTRTRHVILYPLASIAVAVITVLGCMALNFRTPSEANLSKSKMLIEPPKPLTAPLTIKMVTFNIWDLFPIGTSRAKRMQAIGMKLVELKPDLIGFQEAFYPSDRKILLKRLKEAGLIHSHYFRSGFMGSGLLVASRFPIEEVFFHRFSARGKFYKVWHGDWWAGKGICLARVKLPGGRGHLDFFDTHAHAGYGNDEYKDVILSNLKECAAFINAASTKTSPVICTGDFNSGRDSIQNKTLVQDAKLLRLMTIDSAIDHIFGQKNPGYKFKVLETVPIRGTVDVGRKVQKLSDHSGFMSTLLIIPDNAADSVPETP